MYVRVLGDGDLAPREHSSIFRTFATAPRRRAAEIRAVTLVLRHARVIGRVDSRPTCGGLFGPSPFFAVPSLAAVWAKPPCGAVSGTPIA